MHESLVFLKDAALLVLSGIAVLLALVWIGARARAQNPFLTTWPLLLLRPVLPLLSWFGIDVLDWSCSSAQMEGHRPARGFPTVRMAMDYLVNRIVDEAKLEGSPLTEAERKMLYFSETDPALRNMPTVSAEFDREYDEAAYEEKITGLVRRIVARDQRQDQVAQAAWADAVIKISEGDYYLRVLVDALLGGDAGIARPPQDILKLWVAAFGIVFGGFALIDICHSLFGQRLGDIWHWLQGR